MFWKFLKEIQHCLKCRQNSQRIPLKWLVFSNGLGLPLTSLLKNITLPSQVLYK